MDWVGTSHDAEMIFMKDVMRVSPRSGSSFEPHLAPRAFRSQYRRRDSIIFVY